MMEMKQKAPVSKELLPSTVDVATKRRKSRNLVDLYMRTKLLRDLHPSYQAVGQMIKSPALLTTSQTEPALELLTLQTGDEYGHLELTEETSPSGIYREADRETISFKASLKAYEQIADPRFKTDVTLDGASHSWQEILDEVQSLADGYLDKKGNWARIHRKLRKCGENSKRFAGWLELLPSDSEYFSILCGGLKLIIKATARLSKVRKSIFDAIADIPTYLTTTRLVSGIFKSKELHEASSALYVATLSTLDHIVVWLRENAAKKGLKAFWNQDDYEEKLIEKITAIKSSSDKFTKTAQICSYQKQNDMQTDIEQTKGNVHVNLLAIERSRNESSHNYYSLDNSLRIEADATREALMLKNAELNTELRAELKADIKAASLEIVKLFLSANSRLDPITHDLRQPLLLMDKPQTRPTAPEKLQTDAIRHLAYEPCVLAKDIESLLRMAWALSKPAQDRAVTLMKMPKLHEWLGAPHSSMLFVNGNFGNSARQSPLSFVCAKLWDSLEPRNRPPHARGIHAHAFFCGQHLGTRDPYTGVSDMMRSLVAQLVVSQYAKFERPTLMRLLKIDLSSVQALCKTYYDLIMQLPSYATVFCLIDALSFHEDNRRRCKEAQMVMETLDDLVETGDQSDHCIFKVLLTCPGTSRMLHKVVTQSKNMVWMPKKVSPQGGFTSMKWSASAGKEVRELNSINSW